MKIALIAKKVSYTKGGAEMVAANLCKEMSRKGHEAHVYTQQADPDTEGATVHIIQTASLPSALRLVLFRKKASVMTQDKGFDVIYSLCQTYPVDIYRVGDGIHRHWMKIRYPNALVRRIKHLTSPVHAVMRFLENRLFQQNNCGFYITNSRLVKNQVMEYFSIPPERIKVIYNGVNHDTFNPGVQRFRADSRKTLGIGEHDLVLLFVSNNWERKGLSTIIEAMASAGTGNMKLVVVGRGKADAYIALARERGINAKDLMFAGQSADICRFYGMADIFILPSMYEPFANVCLEAMACGLPVVTTQSNGSSELITDGRDGFVLENWDDSAKLAKHIITLSSKSIRESMGKNAAAAALNHTWQQHTQETEEVFKMVLEHRRSR